MDLEELRAFLEVVEAGSVLAAADSKGVSRTTLKRRIEALESRAGVPLMRSTSRGIVLTQAGQTLLERGRVMEREVSVLLSSLRRAGQVPEGLLRVVAPVGLPPAVVTQLLGAVRQRWPALSVDLRPSADPMREDLTDVDLVLHFAAASPVGPWETVELVRLRLWALASQRYLERRGTPESPEDLPGHDLLSWAGPEMDPGAWMVHNAAPMRVRPVMVSPDIHQLRECAIQGLGIALLPDALLPAMSAGDAQLRPVLPEQLSREIGFLISAPALLATSPKISQVLTAVRSFVEQINRSR